MSMQGEIAWNVLKSVLITEIIKRQNKLILEIQAEKDDKKLLHLAGQLHALYEFDIFIKDQYD